MATLYVLDYFMNKHFKISDAPEEIVANLQAGDKIVYRCEEKGTMKESIGLAVGYPLEIERMGFFDRLMSLEEAKDFDQQQDFALKVFPLFKKKFKEHFSGSKPVTARYNPLMDQIYFYFYSEERYVFGDFVKDLKNELGKNIFLFQVGARDMMRLDPQTKDYCVGSDCGMQTACMGLGILPSVEVECIGLQGVDGRDMERLKWRCGKLKCSLIYELELYRQEGKDFPQKWAKVKCPNSDQNAIVTSYNVITKEVVIRTEEGSVLRIPLALLQEANPSISHGKHEEKLSCMEIGSQRHKENI